MSFIFLVAAAIGILLAIAGLAVSIASKESRIVGIVLLCVGFLITVATVGTFVLMVSRMG